MRTPRLESILRVIGFLILPIAAICCVLLILIGMFGQALVVGMLVLVAIYLLCGAPHLIQAVDKFPKIISWYDGDTAFTQTGGLRYESSIGLVNFTIPFATLRVTREAIILTVSFLRLFQRTFSFPRSSIRRLRWRRMLFSLGVQIEHDLASSPSYILFWVSNRKALIKGLRDFGYEISDK
jgi:hypothetical protein